MIKIGITGIEGLIGWHLRAFLHSKPDVQLFGASRSTFADQEKLCSFAASCDVIVHLAGMNRGDEQEVATTNIALVENLITACERVNHKPHIIFSSSIQVVSNTAYGISKKICTERFQRWAEKTGSLFTNLILPHIFGEGGKPFYNSVVATFCYQLANEQKPKIINDSTLELIHAQTVAGKIFSIIKESKGGDVILQGAPITVSQLLEKLTSYAELYRQQIIPSLRDKLELYLFNTYRSYLYPDYYPVNISLHEDNRGQLYEAVKSLNSGQSFISITKPGITRGNHYHTYKIERFLVLSGKAEIRIRKLFSDKTVSFNVDGSKPQYVDIPTLHTHNITNVGSSDLLTLFWVNEIFDPTHPDTFAENV